MEVEFEFTRDDYKNFNLYVAKHKKLFRKSRLASIVMLIILVLLLNYKQLTNVTYMLLQVIILLGIYLILTLILRPISLYSLKLIPSEKGSCLGKHTIILTDEGLANSTTFNKSFTKWEGVLSVEEDKKYIYMFVDKHAAHIIPKRCFSSEQELKKVTDFLKEKVTSVKQ